MAEKKLPQIKDDLKSGMFKNAYLLYGEENFLRDFYVKSLIDKLVDKASFDFNYKEYNAKAPDYDEIEDFLNSYPFMSDWKVLCLKNSDTLKKPSEAVKTFWAKILSDIPPYAVIIFSEKNVDKRSSVYKELNKNFHTEEFPLQQKANLVSWVSRYVGQYNKKMSTDTIEYFLDCCTNKMYILKNELEKLVSYRKDAEVIIAKDIDKCCCRIPESTVWELIDNVLDGKTAVASRKLAELKYQREKPIPIVAAIFSKYASLRKEKLLSKDFSLREIAFKTGQKEYYVKIHLNQIKNYSIKYFEDVMNLCCSADRKIKQTYADGWAEIEIIFARMVQK